MFSREKNSHHNATRDRVASGDGLVRKDHSSIDQELILDLDILSSHCESIYSDPSANCVLPTDNASLNQGVTLDYGSW